MSIDKARTLLGWEPRLSNAETLCATYDWYLAHRDGLGRPASRIACRGTSARSVC